MFPCAALPPPLFPAVLRPPGTLSSPLGRSLPSRFLVEDILQLEPVCYLHRFLPPRNPRSPVAHSPGPGGTGGTERSAAGPGAERLAAPGSIQPGCSSPDSRHTACPDSGLKFGVSAILAPATGSGESPTSMTGF